MRFLDSFPWNLNNKGAVEPILAGFCSPLVERPVFLPQTVNPLLYPPSQTHTHTKKGFESIFIYLFLFLTQSELLDSEKPFKDDPAKQERFEQFLKEKYRGGLRTASSSLACDMSEAARAQERLCFVAAAEAIEKAKQGRGSKPLVPSSMDFITGGVMQFTSGAAEVCLMWIVFYFFSLFSCCFGLSYLMYPVQTAKERPAH